MNRLLPGYGAREISIDYYGIQQIRTLEIQLYSVILRLPPIHRIEIVPSVSFYFLRLIDWQKWEADASVEVMLWFALMPWEDPTARYVLNKNHQPSVEQQHMSSETLGEHTKR